MDIKKCAGENQRFLCTHIARKWGGDASQGTFFEVYGNFVIRYFLYYKKSVPDGIRDSSAHMSPSRGDASQGTFFEVYGNLVKLYFLYDNKAGFADSILKVDFVDTPEISKTIFPAY